MPRFSPTQPSSEDLQGVSAPIAIILAMSLVPAVSASSPALVVPTSAQPIAAMPQPRVRGASSVNVGGTLSVTHSNSKVWRSDTTAETEASSSPWKPTSPLDTTETRPQVAKISSPKGSWMREDSHASVSAGSDGSSSSAESRLFGGAVVWNAPA